MDLTADHLVPFLESQSRRLPYKRVLMSPSTLTLVPGQTSWIVARPTRRPIGNGTENDGPAPFPTAHGVSPVSLG